MTVKVITMVCGNSDRAMMLMNGGAGRHLGDTGPIPNYPPHNPWDSGVPSLPGLGVALVPKLSVTLALWDHDLYRWTGAISLLAKSVVTRPTPRAQQTRASSVRSQGVWEPLESPTPPSHPWGTRAARGAGGGRAGPPHLCPAQPCSWPLGGLHPRPPAPCTRFPTEALDAVCPLGPSAHLGGGQACHTGLPEASTAEQQSPQLRVAPTRPPCPWGPPADQALGVRARNDNGEVITGLSGGHETPGESLWGGRSSQEPGAGLGSAHGPSEATGRSGMLVQQEGDRLDTGKDFLAVKETVQWLREGCSPALPLTG